MKVERLSIELTNKCSKRCAFCYNGSHREGNTTWRPDELDKALVSDTFKVDLVWNVAIAELENEPPVRQFQFRRSISSYNADRFNLQLGFGQGSSSKHWHYTQIDIGGENMNVRVRRTEPGQNKPMATEFKSRYQCELLPFDRIEIHEGSFS